MKSTTNQKMQMNHTSNCNPDFNANVNLHILQLFQQAAVVHKLSASAILLWQHIYFLAQVEGCYQNLCLCTADLTNALSITRNGLQKVRHALMDAGLLQVRIDSRNHIYYTLTIDNVMISEISDHCTVVVDVLGDQNDVSNDQNNLSGNHDDIPNNQNNDKSDHKDIQTNPKPHTNNSSKPYIPDADYPADILRNRQYQKLLMQFCDQFEGDIHRSRLSMRLLQFFHKRLMQGKTLTKVGLDRMLEKLVQLAERNVAKMIAIIEQSMERGWSGFYAYRKRRAQVKQKATAQYEQTSSAQYENHAYGNSYNTYNKYRTPRLPQYDTQKEDLDFLEW